MTIFFQKSLLQYFLIPSVIIILNFEPWVKMSSLRINVTPCIKNKIVQCSVLIKYDRGEIVRYVAPQLMQYWDSIKIFLFIFEYLTRCGLYIGK